MAILSANGHTTGTIGIKPNFIYINTNDTPATVTTAGYLTSAVHEGLISPESTDLAVVGTVTAGVHSSILYEVVITGISPNLVYSLASPANAGGAIFAGDVQAGFNGLAGGFLSYPAALNTGHSNWFATANGGAFNALYTNAALAQTTTFTTPDPGVAAASYLLTQNAGTQTIATGNLALTLGSVASGSPGHLGLLIVYPAATAGAADRLVITALTAGGNFTTTVRNSAMGQSSVISIPDPGAATANFLLDQGANNLITDYSQMLPLDNFLLAPAGGAFVLTRTAQGNWEWLHTAAADTSIIGFDITEQLRVAAGKGFELVSFDVIYSIGTLALNAHTVTLATTVYANNVATAVTNNAVGGALATATQANPYVSNITVTVPAFTNPAAGTAVKQVIELTVNAAVTSVYAYMGINLRFTKSIS